MINVLEQQKQHKFLGQLLPFQFEGVKRLHYILKHNLGCLLADEMGLGKTWQIIALIVDLLNDNKIDNKPGILIIVPSSLISNWKKEFTKVAPDVSIHCYNGKKRHIPECHVIIMPYSLVIKDLTILQKYNWSLLILDEAHIIKDPKGARNQSIISINAKHKIAVTGTPLMNNVFDLWSIYNFINPGCLGTRTQFKYNFLIPWEYDRNKKPRDVTIKIIKSFTIRRYKDKVLNLPPLITTFHFPPLEGLERTEYDRQFKGIALCKKNRTIKKIKNKLNILPRKPVQQDFYRITTAKQTCNHALQPFLTNPTSTDYHKLLNSKYFYQKLPSSKMRKILEIVKPYILEGRQGLIITQFVSGELIEKALLSAGISAKFLRGSCSLAEREQMIKEFQDPASTTKVLVLSLFAAGVGLTLTAATYVIHLDTWWNPATQQQATDRAHRYGQTKTVYEHILVTPDTWEQELYDNVMVRKKGLYHDFYETLKKEQQSMDSQKIPSREEIAMMLNKYLAPREKKYKEKKRKERLKKYALKKQL